SRTQAIGVLLPDIYGEFFSEVIRGVDHAAQRESFQVLISSSHADTDELISAARAMRGRVDGLVIMAPDKASADGIEQIRRRFPLILLNPRFEIAGCNSVSVANYEGAYTVTQHLLRLGHTAVAIIKGPEGNDDADQRLRGYRAALRDSGASIDPELELQGDFTESSGYEAAGCLIRRSERPPAVFAANDCMAIGLLSALSSFGVDVPGDMAVAGFDDIAIAQYLHPPLTTVHVDAYELGARAVRLLVSSSRLAGNEPARHELLPASLVVRQSCGSTRRPDKTASTASSRFQRIQTLQDQRSSTPHTEGARSDSSERSVSPTDAGAGSLQERPISTVHGERSRASRARSAGLASNRPGAAGTWDTASGKAFQPGQTNEENRT
ncbi:MAG: substrate-binding domain-containing protein, partial [Candidatus Eisenbacteria bacterium]|nr:substrate-binding domain-containing protein [Candidatus Eisenbacteria bacterium]